MNTHRPDYSKYTFNELIEAMQSIDKDSYPERHEEILNILRSDPVMAKKVNTYNALQARKEPANETCENDTALNLLCKLVGILLFGGSVAAGSKLAFTINAISPYKLMVILAPLIALLLLVFYFDRKH